MAQFTVKLIATKLNIPEQEFISALQQANISVSAKGVIADKDKSKLVMFMKSYQGDGGFTVTRKLNQNIGSAGNRVKVEITRTQSYVQRPATKDVAPSTVQSKPIESSKKSFATLPKQTTATLKAADNAANVELTTGSEISESKSIHKKPRPYQGTTNARLSEIKPIEPIRKATPEESKAVAESRRKTKASSFNESETKPKRKKQGGFSSEEINIKTLRRVDISNLKEQDYLEDDQNNQLNQSDTASSISIKTKHAFNQPLSQQIQSVEIPTNIEVRELAKRLAIKPKQLLKKLTQMGIDSEIDEDLDFDTAYLISEELGFKPLEQIQQTPETELADYLAAIKRGEEQHRAPVITIMGHVDHGKTSLLDFIRRTKTTDAEAGGITQHLSAYSVKTKQGMITFVDTPGHAAFTAMRARGAQFTDIVVLIIAADDGVMPQTIEIIQHVKASKVPIVVAINKIDRPEANQEKVIQELSQHGIVTEKWGGDVAVVAISATQGTGVDELLETLLLQAEVMELRAAIKGAAEGFVLECRMQQGLGCVTSLLVQKGQLKQGDILVSGYHYAKVRSLISSDQKRVKSVNPAIPVEMTGFAELPTVGDAFVVMPNERLARQLCDYRSQQRKQPAQGPSLENLFSQKDDQLKNLNLLIKADTQGSMEAISDSLSNLSNDQVSVSIVAKGVGGISESDAILAMAQKALIIGFNVRADARAKGVIENHKLSLNYYSVIYEVVDDIEKALVGKLDPEFRETIIGIAEVREVFRAKRIGAVAGCMVTEGEIKRNAPIRVLRDDVVIYEGELESLKRFKEDVHSVRSNTECGIGVKNYNDVRSGDRIEVFEKTEIKPRLTR